MPPAHQMPLRVTSEEEVRVSPLAMATRMRDLSRVEQLLDASADPNEQDCVGETPLFEAAINADVSVACALLLHGADPEWRSSIGGVPADLAEETPMIALLKVTSGEEVTEEEQDEIISAVDPSLRRRVMRFIMSLTGEDERLEREQAARERAAKEFEAVSGLHSRSSASCTKDKDVAVAQEEVDVLVCHAIQESSTIVRVPGSATFGDVKKAIRQELCLQAQDLYLLRKENGMYQAYKDNQRIGPVREVRVLEASS